MARKQLLITEQDPTDTDYGRVFGLDANNASGVPIPAFKFGTTLPTTGSVAGEAFIDTTTNVASVWDGNKWNGIIPSSIVSYPTEAAILAATPAVGTYAFAMDSGNLFVRYNAPTGVGAATAPAWKNIGITMYNTQAALLAANTAPVGEMAFARDTGLMFLKEPTGWRPNSIWNTLEATILATTTGMVGGQMATATDTGRLYCWNATQNRWEATSVNSPRAGVGEIIAWPTDTFDAAEYLPCDGQTVARATYPDLFTAIGTTYNKPTDADATLFRLPDLRGLFLRGTGARGGEVHAGVEQSDTTKRPGTPLTGSTSDSGQHHHNMPILVYPDADLASGYGGYWDAGKTDGHVPKNIVDQNFHRTVPYTEDNGSHHHTVTIDGGGDVETRPKNMSVRWVIRHRAINGGAQGAKGDKGDKGDSITVWTGTQAQYDAIAPKVATTLYVIHA